MKPFPSINRSSVIIIILSSFLVAACGQDSNESRTNDLFQTLTGPDTVRAPESRDALEKRCELIQNRGPADQADEAAQENVESRMGNRPPNAGRPGNVDAPGQNRTPPGQDRRNEDADEEVELDEPGKSEDSARIDCPTDASDEDEDIDEEDAAESESDEDE